MTEYVAGFMFSEDKEKVALILKNRPLWQRGKKNGIGGHVEPNESGYEAMVREFEEETGVKHEDWTCFCELTGPWGVVRFYKATGYLYALSNMTDECICLCEVRHLTNIVPNLRWLIPLALSDHNEFASVRHGDEETPEGGW